MSSRSNIVMREISAFKPLMTTWRRDIHQHPELAFEEQRTAQLVADKLAEWGFEVFSGIAHTGVVGRLRMGNSNKAIGLRADMDALPMQELGDIPHRSIHTGKFHGCGHDGHTTMLLGAAKYLAESRQFDGTVYCVFQPAEEHLGGAIVMVKEGLFERFPMDFIFGMHNWPGLDLGHFAIIPGPMMAAFSSFDIKLTGVGGHGAFPHICRDPVVVAAEIITALQTIVSRNIDPNKTAVVSVTQMHAGDAYNVIPNEAILRGSVRFFEKAVGETIRSRLFEIVNGIAAAHNMHCEIAYDDAYSTLVNDAEATIAAAEAAQDVVGVANVGRDFDKIMASEDFAYMLEHKRGAYIFVGNGAGVGGCMVHHPSYDFNDEALVYGASYWVRLVERLMPINAGA
jgi:amidohydrolase